MLCYSASLPGVVLVWRSPYRCTIARTLYSSCSELGTLSLPSLGYCWCVVHLQQGMNASLVLEEALESKESCMLLEAIDVELLLLLWPRTASSDSLADSTPSHVTVICYLANIWRLGSTHSIWWSEWSTTEAPHSPCLTGKGSYCNFDKSCSKLVEAPLATTDKSSGIVVIDFVVPSFLKFWKLPMLWLPQPQGSSMQTF